MGKMISLSRGSFWFTLVLTLDTMGLCSNSCMLGYRPFTCTTCIKFTEVELVYSSDICEPPSSIFQMEDIEMDILYRYMEAYNRPYYWTGYKLQNNKAVLPDSNIPVNLSINTKNCNDSSCCVAWKLDPFGLIATDCNREFPALCITHLTESFPSGSGQENPILVFLDEELLPDNDNHDIIFGANIALNCSHEQSDNIKWYINDNEVNGEDMLSSTTNSVLKLIFEESGLYQCKVTTNETVREYHVTLCGIDGVPADIDILTAVPYSQTELKVSWIPPHILGTSDPLLLRYQLLYTKEDVLSNKSELEVVTPQANNDDLVEVILPNLQKGQIYIIGVVATIQLTTTITLPKLNTKVSTYGQAPAQSVQGLMVERLNEKTLHVSWKRAELLLPEGPVSLYEVEYRDAQQTLSNIVYVQHHSTSLILREVTNISDYEIRVAILVEVNRNPLEYDKSPWTDWFSTKRMDPTEPATSSGSTGPIKPTTPEEHQRNADVKLIVLVPIAIFLVIALLVVSTVILGCIKAKQKRYDKGTFSALPEPANKNYEVSML